MTADARFRLFPVLLIIALALGCSSSPQPADQTIGDETDDDVAAEEVDEAQEQAEESDEEVLGTLEREEIQQVVAAGQATFQFCYEQELLEDPEFEISVTMNWVIETDGSVTDAHAAEDFIGPERLERCLTQAVQRLTFPEPDGGGVVHVIYPFEFGISDE